MAEGLVLPEDFAGFCKVLHTESLKIDYRVYVAKLFSR